MALALLAIAGLTAADLPGEPIQPVPLTTHVDLPRARLGQRLFSDPRLSGNRRLACATCHDLAEHGTDGLARSAKLEGTRSGRNTPTVLNAALNFRQFRDGRSTSIEAHVSAVIRNPLEMGSGWPMAVERVAAGGFAHGYTTRQQGHGFGLHSAAVGAREMGGRLEVRSDGAGRRARFTLELPLELPPDLPLDMPIARSMEAA